MKASPATKNAAMFATVLLFMSASVSVGAVVYSNDFESAAGSEWSNTTRENTPSGRGFLGRLRKEDDTLSLTGLAAHTSINVTFDLFIIESWDGNDPTNGPDVWDLSVVGGPTLLHTSFSNLTAQQSYPGTYPTGSFAPRTGATEVATLGYPGGGEDAVYHLSFTFAHASSSLALDFSGLGLSSINPIDDTEAWGLDNMQITSSVPEPCGMAAAWLTCCVLGRRKR